MPTINVRNLECHLQQNVLIYYQDDLPYTGNVYELLGNQIDVAYQVVDGLKHGFELEFYPDAELERYPNKRIQSVRHYINNLLNGKLIYLDENGLIEEISVFEKGVCVESTYYSESNQANEVVYSLSPESPEFAWFDYVQREHTLEYA